MTTRNVFKWLKGALIVALTIVAMGMVTWAYARPALCVDRAKLVVVLQEKLNQVPVVIGVSEKNTEALEIFASDAGAWTAVLTATNGVSCVMAAGHSWQSIL